MQVIRRNEGIQYKVLGDAVTIKVPSNSSKFGQAIVTVEVPPGSGTPCVTHDNEEEVYYVLEGELLMHTPTEKHVLKPGDMVHLPPLTAHGYRNPGATPARFLSWTVGGPMDQFFVSMSKRVQQLPEDLPVMQEILTEYGVRRVV